MLTSCMACRSVTRWSLAIAVGLFFGCTAQAAAAKPSAAKKPSPPKTEKSKPGAGEAEKAVKPTSEGKAEKAGGEKAPKAEETVVGKGDEKMKVYKFEAVDVEGRMKAPQVIYFLRRVRKEFRAGRLGHRSFMLELSDTRRHSSLR